MNENQQSYGLIQLHFDVRSDAEMNYIVSAKETPDGIELNSLEEFDVAGSNEGSIAARIVDVCMKTATENRGSSIEAFVYPGAPRKTILSIGSQFGSVRFALRSELDKESKGGRFVTSLAEEWVHGRNIPVVENIESDVTHVATDGSLNKFYAGGSYGWISSLGEFGYGTVPSAESVLLCELLAIKEMLVKMKKKRDIRILVDNRLAIKISRNPDSMDGSNLVSARAKKLAREISDIVKTRSNVEFRWVRGHSGHPLNEGADRLARNARLSQSFDQDSSTVEKIASSIADDINEEYLSYSESII